MMASAVADRPDLAPFAKAPSTRQSPLKGKNQKANIKMAESPDFGFRIRARIRNLQSV